jgi:tRNA A37 N6-isopentenylltransferase MiaA
MSADALQTPLIVILGPTAGGKSDLAIALALALRSPDGEPGQVISADSMQVYKHMDAGTAKPSPAQRALVPHHCIDTTEPTQRFTVADWLSQAQSIITPLRARGVTPIVVGGTNLYIKALLEGLFDGPGIDEAFRAECALIEPQELHRRLALVDAPTAQRLHPNDRKKITRALEVHHLTGQPISAMQTQWSDGEFAIGSRVWGLGSRDEEAPRGSSAGRSNDVVTSEIRNQTSEIDDSPANTPDPRPTTLDPRPQTIDPSPPTLDPVLIGLSWPVDAINKRINLRVKAMFDPKKAFEQDGFEHWPGVSLVDETRDLLSRNLLGPQAREALGYKQVIEALAGQMSLNDALERTKILTRRYAKTQRTWLKRFRATHWLDGTQPTQLLLEQSLAILHRSNA